jgi:hypothetical protein
MRTEHQTSGITPADLLTKDHYLPRCYGGQTHVDNLVAACGQCNWMRGALEAETFYLLVRQWFRRDQTLAERWHMLSRAEFSSFKAKCERIDCIKWQRRIKRCIGAMTLNTIVPIPLPPHLMRA